LRPFGCDLALYFSQEQDFLESMFFVDFLGKALHNDKPFGNFPESMLFAYL
jgi:hypothetical protein